MSDPIVDSILGNINWTQNRMLRDTSALTEAEFCRQPSPSAPPIGWHVFHVARLADMLQASFPNRQQFWDKEKLAAEIGLDPTKLGLLQMGATQSHADAANIPIVIGQERLIAYARSAFDLTDDVLQDLTVDDLYTPRESILKINWSAQPLTEGKGADGLLFDDVQFHMTHTQRHLGMIEALIGATLNREGTATV